MKTIFRLIIATLLVGGGILVGTHKAKGQKAEPEDKPNSVTRGDHTLLERAYGKELRKYIPPTGNRKLLDFSETRFRPNSDTSDITITIGERDSTQIMGISLPTGDSFLHDLSCASDLIARVEVSKKTGHLMDNDDSVFTEYSAAVTDVIKNNPAMPVDLGGNIAFARPGGAIILDGRTIRVNDLSYPELDVHKEYILFLKYIPEIGGYVLASDKGGDFAIEGDKYQPLPADGLPAELRLNNDLSSIRSRISSKVDAGCKAQRDGKKR